MRHNAFRARSGRYRHSRGSRTRCSRCRTHNRSSFAFGASPTLSHCAGPADLILISTDAARSLFFHSFFSHRLLISNSGRSPQSGPLSAAERLSRRLPPRPYHVGLPSTGRRGYRQSKCVLARLNAVQVCRSRIRVITAGILFSPTCSR